MIQVALLSIALMLSGSVRTPKDDTKPLDYEVATGLELGKESQFEFWTWTEREAGEQFTGVDTKASHKYAQAFFKNRQSSGTIRGGISLKHTLSHGPYLGVSQIWDHYAPATCALIGIKHPYIATQLTIYRDGIESYSFSLTKEYKASELVSLAPMFKYDIDRGGSDYLQGKIVLKLHNNGK